LVCSISAAFHAPPLLDLLFSRYRGQHVGVLLKITPTCCSGKNVKPTVRSFYAVNRCTTCRDTDVHRAVALAGQNAGDGLFHCGVDRNSQAFWRGAHLAKPSKSGVLRPDQRVALLCWRK
jgi:hypothetical protein